LLVLPVVKTSNRLLLTSSEVRDSLMTRSAASWPSVNHNKVEYHSSNKDFSSNLNRDSSSNLNRDSSSKLNRDSSSNLNRDSSSNLNRVSSSNLNRDSQDREEFLPSKQLSLLSRRKYLLDQRCFSTSQSTVRAGAAS